jgi:ribosomal protein L37E
MALFSCNGCGDDAVLIDLGYCASCGLEKGLITEAQYDELMEEA